MRWHHVASLLAPLLALASAGPACAALQTVDPGPYTLADTGTLAAKEQVIDGLAQTMPAAGVDVILADGNRRTTRLPAGGALRSVTGVVAGFGWRADDERDATWYPQGISGSSDASSDGLVAGHHVIVASWYSKAGKGTRVSFVDADRLASATYRHVLLVDPVRDGGGAADFRPVRVHAGGIAWFGRWLFVADTYVGLRVFDTARMLRTTSADEAAIGRDGAGRYRAYGYRYVLPQVASYAQPAGEGMRFSFVSVDRTAPVASLITGEYRAGAPGGRIVRWPLDPETGTIRGPASQAVVSDVPSMQGAASIGGRYFISASARRRPGALGVAWPEQPIATSPWSMSSEDLSFSPESSRLYSLTESPGQRVVFAVAAAPATDTSPPLILAGPSLQPARFRARSGGVLRLTVSEAGSAAVTVQRRRGGRRAGGRCVRSRRTLLRHRLCMRYVTAARMTVRLTQGANAVTIKSPIGRHRLVPGSYRASALVSNAASIPGTPFTVRFRVTRR